VDRLPRISLVNIRRPAPGSGFDSISSELESIGWRSKTGTAQWVVALDPVNLLAQTSQSKLRILLHLRLDLDRIEWFDLMKERPPIYLWAGSCFIQLFLDTNHPRLIGCITKLQQATFNFGGYAMNEISWHIRFDGLLGKRGGPEVNHGLLLKRIAILAFQRQLESYSKEQPCMRSNQYLSYGTIQLGCVCGSSFPSTACHVDDHLQGNLWPSVSRSSSRVFSQILAGGTALPLVRRSVKSSSVPIPGLVVS
jgi:hypothetical protein